VDSEANHKWNDERGKVTRPLTTLGRAIAAGQWEFARQIGKEFGCGPALPLCLPMEILKHNDDGETDKLDDLHRQLKAAKAKQAEIAANASAAHRRKSIKRRQAITANNIGIFNSVKEGGMTANSATIHIRKRWGSLGDSGPVIAERTLNKWLADHKMGQTLHDL